MSLTQLPYTLFLDILAWIPPVDIIACRRLSSEFRRVLLRDDLCTSLILVHFPRSREGRALRQRTGAGCGDGWDDVMRPDDRHGAADIFARLARRYFHLGNAIPWRIEKVQQLGCRLGPSAAPVGADRSSFSLPYVRPMELWGTHLRLNDKIAPFHYQEPLWTCDAAAGLLVYPTDSDELTQQQPVYRARDLDTGAETVVPFDVFGKTVIRTRLAHGVLVFEWCVQNGGGQEESHNTGMLGHCVTAYVVSRANNETGLLAGGTDEKSKMVSSTWHFTRLSEWATQPMCAPMDPSTRIHSTHNGTHYVAYTWNLPDEEREAQETLTIWDMGQSSIATHEAGKALCVSTLGVDHLDALGIRQGHMPTFSGLEMDDHTWDEPSRSVCGHFYFLEEDHRWSYGSYARRGKPRLHRVRSTGVPLVGAGPHWVDDCGGRDYGSPSSGNGGSDGTPGFCRRRWPGWIPMRRGGDQPKRRCRRATAVAAADAYEALPGRAPCWRHDDFPYLTVAEVFDVAAGVRVSARQCFMLETLSVHVRPKLCVQGVGVDVGANGGANGDIDAVYADSDFETSPSCSSRSSISTNDNDDSRPGKAVDSPPRNGHGPARQQRRHKGGKRARGPSGVEVQFEDGMWSELLGGGRLCGDERWLVGQDSSQRIAIAYF